MRQFLLRNRFFVVAGALGILIRALLALAMNYWWSRAEGDGLLPKSDEITNYYVGQRISASLHTGMSVAATDIQLMDPHIGYYHVVGWLIYLFDIAPLGLRLLNVVVGLIPPMVFLALCREADLGRRAEKIFFALAIFIPSVIFWNAMVLKETIVYALSSVVLLGGGRMALNEKVTLMDIVLFTLPLLLLSVFRSYACLILLFALVAVSLVLAKDRLGAGMVAIAAVACLTAFNVDVWTLVMQVIYGYSPPGMIGGYTGEGRIADIKDGLAALGSVIPPDASRLSRLGYFFAFPLPGQAQTAFQVLAVPEVVATLVLFPFAVYGVGLRLAARDKIAVQFLVVGALFLCLYLYTLSNLGTIYRMKSGLAIYFLYFTAAGLDTAWRKWRPEP